MYLCKILRMISWKVPVAHVQQCNLLDYEQKLLSIVLSHCHYSLQHGCGQDISYDLPALEKHIVGSFIHGKPLLQLGFPLVVYRTDVYTTATFANIRKKVYPQVFNIYLLCCNVSEKCICFAVGR